MITEEQENALVDRLMKRVNKANSYFLQEIGTSIKKIGKLSPSKAHELIQMLKYGGNYEEIIKKLSKILNMNINEVDTIFNEYAKKDYEFYKGFYQYRNIPFIEYSNNRALVNQTTAISNMVKNELYDYTRRNVLGYSFTDLDGNTTFKGLRDTYNDLLDRAYVLIGQGKETFDTGMKSILEDIGGSGIKTINYESGRAVRLDSVIRMHLKSRLLELHNENQKIIGSEIDADGVEISVHSNPAPDHEDAQGRQFETKEFEKLQSYGSATDYTGKFIDMHLSLSPSFRPISELNCYHKFFVIVLGVNKPDYTDEELQQIKDENNKGFDFEGKHYTNYEGTQLQRQIETKIRREKDILELAQASDNKSLESASKTRMRILRDKYKQLSIASGIKGKPKRMRV